MKYLTLQDALTLHNDIMQVMGGLNSANPSALALLESALAQIQNDEYYPSFIDKLTHMVFCCVKFHPFVDGNKRTAIYLADAFITLNGKILPSDFYQRLEDVVVDVASGAISKDELKALLQSLLA